MVKTSCKSKSCFSRINRQSGEVKRGCATDNICGSDKDCHICDGQRCNTQKLPVTICYNCIGQDCVNPDVNNVATLSCEDGNKCIVKYNDKGHVFRGCTEVPDQQCAQGEPCKICDKDKCNSGKFPYQENATLSCIKCDSSQGENCLESNLQSTEARKCLGTYPFYNKEACFVQRNINSIVRGCFYELNERDQENCEKDRNCDICTTEGCNRFDNLIEYPNFKCFICDNCESASGISSSECSPMPNSKNGGPGCFVKRENGVVRRNCLSKMGSTFSCTEENSCIKCEKESCNTMNAPGRSQKLFGTNYLLFIGFCIIYLNFCDIKL